jgi:hypothetical protein
VLFEHGNDPVGHVSPGLFFSHRAKRIYDGHIDIVVLAARFNGGLGNIQHSW